MNIHNIKISLLTAGLMIAASGCSLPTSKSANLNDSSVPAPRPADPSTIDAQLSRFKGQTQFLNLRTNYSHRFYDGAQPAAAKSGEGQRGVQESDIFKVGKPGSRLLYVLNDYRGLQVISFAKGAESPELIGRVEATGNYPTDMYFDDASERLIVLERNWNDDSSGSYTAPASRLLVYSVKNPAKPEITQKIDIKGEISDSRMVGNILYVAATEWPSYGYADRKAEGHVYSFMISSTVSDAVVTVAEHKLALPVSRRENMNIVEVLEGESYKYYLVAVLSEDGWGWWGSKSAVEVVDISSPTGEIKPIMLASAKGFLEERSSTHIKNNTLIVVSNYMTEASDGTNSLMRVAVESFKFPGDNTTIISEDEAEFRRLNIERKMRNVPAGIDPEDYRKTLLNDPELGIAGIFVKTSLGLKKLTPDASATVGDTTGLHADVQDVRFDGNLLYVFWVPANMRDPLDVFDISNPETSVKHLKRELFEGWIERAIPVTYANRNFIIGLGWIIPSNDNESPRRVPQAMLFEVNRRGPSVTIDTVGQMNLSGRNIWADFNDQDKFLETKFNNDGTGALMFKISSWGDRYVSGGKLISFNLNKAISGEFDGIFTEGALIQGSSEWLRRVFTNKEIDMVNTLTNKSLGVFSVNWRAVGAADEIKDAVATLELARDIKSFTTISDDSNQEFGIQIVQNGDEWNYWSNNSDAATELRLVATINADAELAAVSSKSSITGRYLTHTVVGKNLIVATSQLVRERQDSGEESWVTTYRIARIAVENGQISKLAEASFNETATYGSGYGRGHIGIWWPYYNQSASILASNSGRLFLSTYGNVRELVLAARGLEVVSTNFAGSCSRDLGVAWNLTASTNGMVATWSEILIHPNPEMVDLELVKNFVAAVTDSGVAGSDIGCSTQINIPGTFLAGSVVDGSHIVSNDNRVIEIKEHTYEYRDNAGNIVRRKSFEPVTARVLTALDRKATGLATLRDMYDVNSMTSVAHVLPGTGNIQLVAMEKQGEYSPPSLAHISLDQDGDFVKRAWQLELTREYASARILKTTLDPQADGRFLLVVAQGMTGHVVQLDQNGAVALINTKQINNDGSFADAKVSFRIPGWWWSTSEGETIYFDKNTASFSFAGGLTGIRQVVLDR